ncbi:hypothetical protein [Candidatus Sororendozoicomonas aggregata]|uniref:hypothetical protein n=1 Tax=Candidatus Sororendozoicomonas aggregata TaxID=3073239 RepID=UPI002ED46208
MFDKSIQFPSVAVLSFVFSCIAHTAPADAKVYSITPHGDAKVSSKTSYSSRESVNIVSELKITVPKYDIRNYVEIKADLYYELGDRELGVAHDDNVWFGANQTELKHGGRLGKEKFTYRIWCNSSGSDGYIIRRFSSCKPEKCFVIGHISCAKKG